MPENPMQPRFRPHRPLGVLQAAPWKPLRRSRLVLGLLLVLACGRGDTFLAPDDANGANDAEINTPSATSQGAPMQAQPDFYLGGIQVNEDDHETWLDALQARGMNTVSVTDYAKQGDWDTDHLWWDEDNPGMLAEVQAAKRRRMHVVMILRVALDHAFERNRFLWHGMIMPSSDQQLDSWFEQYTRFVLRWARIAEHEGVDVLMIGSEMNALASTLPLEELPPLEEYFLNPEKQTQRKEQLLGQQQLIEQRHLYLPERDNYDDLETYIDDRVQIEAEWAAKVTAGGDGPSLEELNRRRRLLQSHWLEFIRQVRQVYSGRLGYAANFDQYQLVGFWPQLDVLGINAYFKVRERLLPPGDHEALYRHLEAGWSTVLDDIATFRSSQGLDDMRVIFSEMGYTFRANSTLQPWADTGFALIENGLKGDPDHQERLIVWRDEPEDFEERALAVRALYNAHRRLADPFLQGILYWKLSTVRSHHDIESFVLLIDETSQDPLISELQRFTKP